MSEEVKKALKEDFTGIVGAFEVLGQCFNEIFTNIFYRLDILEKESKIRANQVEIVPNSHQIKESLSKKPKIPEHQLSVR